VQDRRLPVEADQQPVQELQQGELTLSERIGAAEDEHAVALGGEVRRQGHLRRGSPRRRALQPGPHDPSVGEPARDVVHLQRPAFQRGEVAAQDGMSPGGLRHGVAVDLGAVPVELLVDRPHPLCHRGTWGAMAERHSPGLERVAELRGDPLLRELGGRSAERVRHQLQPLAFGTTAPHITSVASPTRHANSGYGAHGPATGAIPTSRSSRRCHPAPRIAASPAGTWTRGESSMSDVTVRLPTAERTAR
jgi:hypothetical protein